MEKILSFEKFNESKSLPPAGKDWNDYSEEVKNFIFVYDNIMSKTLLKKNNWTYDAFASLQVDSKLPASCCVNDKFTLLVIHDDYDNTGWGVTFLETYNDGSDDVIAMVDNLDILDAWQIYETLVGKENAKLTLKENSNKLTDIYTWLENNPLHASKKLKNLKKTGVFEARNLNDPILMDYRASLEMEKKWKKEDAKREIKQQAKREADKLAVRKRRSLSIIDYNIKTLEYEKKQIMQEMENDPYIEAEGGEVADQYGNMLNKIDKKIEAFRKKKEVINNPVLKSKTLKDLNDKTGIFEKDVE